MIQSKTDRSSLVLRLESLCLCVLVLLTTGCGSAGPRSEMPGPGDDVFTSSGVLELALDLSASELEALKNNKDSQSISSPPDGARGATLILV